MPPTCRNTPRDASTGARAAPQTLRAALWDDFPLVYVALGGVGVTLVGLGLEAPTSAYFQWTWIFSSLFLLAVTALRWRSASPVQRKAGAWMVGANLATNAVLLVVRPEVRLPLEQLRLYYEISILVLLVIFTIHMWQWKPSLIPLFFGPILLFGVLLENGGIAIGLYGETHGHFYMPFLPAPLATMLGWVAIIYLALFTTWRLREALPALGRSPILSAAVLTSAALLVDLHVDPYATAIGMWTWDPGLPPAVFGVPAANWVAWTAALLPFAIWIFRREQRLGLAAGELGGRPHPRALLRAVLPLCVASLAVFGVGMALVEAGFSGPTYAVLTRLFQ